MMLSYQSGVHPKRENFYIGGVASSCVSEVAGEENGIVVPMYGEYDTSDLIETYQETISFYKENITSFINKSDSSRNSSDDVKHWAQMIINLEEEIEGIKAWDIDEGQASRHGDSPCDVLRLVKEIFEPQELDYEDGYMRLKVKPEQWQEMVNKIDKILTEG